VTIEAVGLWAIPLVGAVAYRLARLVSADTLTVAARERVYRFAWRDENTPRAGWRTYVYELMSCAHCLGIWAAAGVVAAWYVWPWVWWPVLVLAAAGVQSAVTSILE
jgi:hypothetical protein